MGKKIFWNKNYSSEYLVDRAFNQFTYAEHGLLKIINDILWTQTDVPGKYVVHGRVGTADELMTDTKRYAHGSRRERRRATDRHLRRLFEAQALAQDEHGIIYSPFICNEVEKSELNTERGKRGGNPGLTAPLNPPLIPGVKPRSREREERDNSILSDTRVDSDAHARSKPRAQKFPDAITFRNRDYQEEVLNKLEGRPPESEHPSRATFLTIGREVPTDLIHKALASAQDKRLQSLGRPDGPSKNFTRYYLGTIRNICKEHNLKTSINWNGDQSDETNRAPRETIRPRDETNDLKSVLDQLPPEEANP